MYRNCEDTAMSQHVLIVDDDPALRGLLSEVLADDGFTVQSVATGEEALNQVATDPPGLLLLDADLPHLDGWTVLRRVREGQYPVPVVLMSVGPHRRRATARAQAAGYLAKPFELDDLIHSVERFARRQGQV
jgi:DNA-binding response OmpR family regulator